MSLATPSEKARNPATLAGCIKASTTISAVREAPISGVVATFTASGSIPVPLLTAVSLGSVFMGANTYIGNGPNFMVKSIAEQAGVRMPSFFGYMLYSMAILIPLFIVVTLVFFS